MELSVSHLLELQTPGMGGSGAMAICRNWGRLAFETGLDDLVRCSSAPSRVSDCPFLLTGA
eukprot:1383775-Karenia_brevis.AAC.1